MKSSFQGAEILRPSLDNKNYVSVSTERLQPQEIWLFCSHKGDMEKFASYLYDTFHLLVPAVGSIREAKGRQIIHFEDSSYFIIINTGGLNKKNLRTFSKFGKIRDLSAGVVVLRIKGRGSHELINRLVGIDAKEMEKSKNTVVYISSQVVSINKINKAVFEMIIPASYLLYFMSLIDSILLMLQNKDKLSIEIDDLYLKLRNQ